MVRIILIILLLFNTVYAENIRSFYDDFLKPGAESKGYADALTASSLGLITVFYNPANLALDNYMIDFYLSKENYYLLDDITYLTAGVGARFFKDPVVYSAISWRKFDYFDVVDYDDNENIIMLSLGVKKNIFLFGMNMKYFYSSVDSPDLKYNLKGIGLDIGSSLKFDKILFSISLLNIATKLKYSDDITDSAPKQYRIGVNYSLLDNMNIYLDGSSLNNNNIASFAIDYDLIRVLKFSTGLSTKKEVGAGIYFTINSFTLKYGFSYSLVDFLNKNSISFTLGI